MHKVSVPILLLLVACGSDEPPVKRLFVTSEVYPGNLGGVAGADASCQSVADAASEAEVLDAEGAMWTAWISDSTTGAIDRLDDVGPWFRVDGTTQVFDDKAHVALDPPALLEAIDTDETGVRVATLAIWTGTLPGGIASEETCVDWTSNSPTPTTGEIGSAFATDALWTSGGQAGCNASYPLICFEQ